MNRTAKYLLIGLVVLCLAYPGMAWLIGFQVEASSLKREQQALDQYPGSITLISRHYHRGVYGATEELIYGFSASALRALAPLAPITDAGALQVTVRNTIHHGPLPQFRSIALATLTTQVELPAQLSAKLRALLGGAPAIEIHSRLGWLGGMTTVIASPGYEGRLTDGTQISWHGLRATSSANSDLSSRSFDGSLDSFEVAAAKLHVQMAGLHVGADWKRVFGGLYTGPLDLKVTTVKWQTLPASGQGLLQGLSISGSGSADGDYYSSAVQFGADVLQTSGFSVTHAGYALSFEHLHGPTLAAMMQDARGSAVNAGAATPPSSAPPLANMKKNGIELLLHEPVLNITRIGFTMPEGELRFSAKASAPGLKREDLDGPQLQGTLMEHLNVVADLRIDTALATRLMAGNARKDALTAQLAELERQGFIKRDGAALTSHLAFTGGSMTVNGHAYPPRPGT
jgi:uncharacterized protein YdgA (DUF945 family)